MQVLASTHAMPVWPPNTIVDESNLVKLAHEAASLGCALYLFATQGLDLAIPARTEWLGPQHLVWRNSAKDIINDMLFPDKPRTQCQGKEAAIAFRSGGGVAIRCNGLASSENIATRDSRVARLWRSKENLEDAGSCFEAACVRVACSSGNQTACSTRICPPKLSVPPLQPVQGTARPDILLIMIDPISRPQLLRALPKTVALMERLGYARFEKYTSVGLNSGPNQVSAGKMMRLL